MLHRARILADQIIAWRRFVHQHPELSFEEFGTTRFVTQTLQEMGIQVKTEAGKTGVIGFIGQGPPVIGLRADMDALPIQEETGLPFASDRQGVMHACGHDAHVACLLGAAQLLSETPPSSGGIRLFFQPAEESPDAKGISGATYMLQEGALDGVDAVVGLHIWAEVPAGQVALSPGPQMASAGTFRVRIFGQGGHGAMPHRTVDPIVLAAQAILALQTVVSRRLDPVEPGVVTIGTIHGGARENIIPEYVDLSGTLRSLNSQVYQQLKDEVTRALGIVRALGGEFQATFGPSYPVVYNNPELTSLVMQVAADMLDTSNVLPAEPVMGGEDFGTLAERTPGCYFRLGGGFPGQTLRNHHDSHFDIDESALPIGAAILAETALRYLSR